MYSNLIQDDFMQGYASLNSYPKIINWTIEAPLVFGEMQITPSVLQRKETEDSSWVYLPSLKVSSALTSTSEDMYSEDPFLNDSDIALTSANSFEDAIDSILQKTNDLIDKYN